MLFCRPAGWLWIPSGAAGTVRPYPHYRDNGDPCPGGSWQCPDPACRGGLQDVLRISGVQTLGKRGNSRPGILSCITTSLKGVIFSLHGTIFPIGIPGICSAPHIMRFGVSWFTAFFSTTVRMLSYAISSRRLTAGFFTGLMGDINIVFSVRADFLEDSWIGGRKTKILRL